MKNRILSTILLILPALSWTKPNDLDFTLPLPDNVKPTLILKFPPKADKFFSISEALRICRSYQELNNKKYFFVFCKFAFDEILDKEYGYFESEDWSLEGISLSEDRDCWGYFRRKENPVIKKEKIGRWEKHKFNRPLAYLTIWGIGDLKTEPLRVLYPQVDDIELKSLLYFESKAQAMLDCFEILNDKKQLAPDALRYEGAKCVAIYDDEKKKFSFEIRSQNPLL